MIDGNRPWACGPQIHHKRIAHRRPAERGRSRHRHIHRARLPCHRREHELAIHNRRRKLRRVCRRDRKRHQGRLRGDRHVGKLHEVIRLNDVVSVDVPQREIVEGFIAVVRGGVVCERAGHRVDDRHPRAKHPPKHRETTILSIEFRVVPEIEKELVGRTVGQASQLRHRNRARRVEIARLIDDGRLLRHPNRIAARQIGGNVWRGIPTALNHEAGHGSVDDRVVVVIERVGIIHVAQEVAHRGWRCAGAAGAQLIEHLHKEIGVRQRGVRGKLHHRARDGRLIEVLREVDRDGCGRGERLSWDNVE